MQTPAALISDNIVNAITETTVKLHIMLLFDRNVDSDDGQGHLLMFLFILRQLWYRQSL